MTAVSAAGLRKLIGEHRNRGTGINALTFRRLKEKLMSDGKKEDLPDFLAITNDEDRAIAEEYIHRHCFVV